MSLYLNLYLFFRQNCVKIKFIFYLGKINLKIYVYFTKKDDFIHICEIVLLLSYILGRNLNVYTYYYTEILSRQRCFK